MIGYAFTARDSRGWRIPNKKTVSHTIYVLTLRGLGPQAIADKIGHDARVIRNLLFAIRHPDSANARQRRRNARLRKA